MKNMLHICQYNTYILNNSNIHVQYCNDITGWKYRWSLSNSGFNWLYVLNRWNAFHRNRCRQGEVKWYSWLTVRKSPWKLG